MARKRKISLVLADVDGTLVNEEKVLTERAQSARSRSCDAPASALQLPVAGRRSAWPCCSIRSRIDTPIAGFNGGLFVERDLTILEQKTVPDDVASQAIDLIRDHGLDAWVYRGNDWLITKADAPHVAREAWTVKFEPKIVARSSADI